MIRLRTLGSVGMETVEAKSASAVLAQPKRLAVLAYLALARPRGARRRDTLLAMFWPELDESRARHALSQTLHFLRQKLGHDVVKATGAEDVAVDAVASDVFDFEQAIERGDDQTALELYAGELLSGFHLHDAPGFEQWLDGERARLRTRATGAAHSAAEKVGAAGRRREAVKWAARAVELDALNERAVRRLMRAQDAAGDRSAALRAYREFEARLRAQLDAQR